MESLHAANENGKSYRMEIFNSTSRLPDKALTGFEYDSCPRGGVVYIIEAHDGKVKVGRSAHPRSRVETVVRSSGVKLNRVAVSSVITNSSTVENSIKLALAKTRINGEWYATSFAGAVKMVEGEEFEFDSADSSEQSRQRSVQNQAALEEMIYRGTPLEKPKFDSHEPNMDADKYVNLCRDLFGDQAAQELAVKLGVPYVILPAGWDEEDSSDGKFYGASEKTGRALSMIGLARAVHGQAFAGALWHDLGLPLSPAMGPWPR